MTRFVSLLVLCGALPTLADAITAAKPVPVVLRVENTGKVGTAQEFVGGVEQAQGEYVNILEVITNEGPDKELATRRQTMIWHDKGVALPVGEFTAYLTPKIHEKGLCDYSLVTTPATDRAAQLEREVIHGVFELRYFGEQDKPYYKVLFGGPDVQLPEWADGSARVAQLTAAQTRKLVAHLAGEGFLVNAANVRQKKMKMPTGPCYVMSVRAKDIELWEELPWNLTMLNRLDALRAVLDGDAGKAMETLLGRLSGHRREWEGQK